MNTIVVSYSLTGNNDALAKSIAAALDVRHIAIAESKKRTNGTIVSDLLLGRSPKVEPGADAVEGKDLIVFVGPIWMGNVATPLRVYFKRLKKNPCKYAFVSISGGALGPNPKLAAELKKRVGAEPTAVIDMHIADLLVGDTKPSMKDTSDYKITRDDIKKLTDTAVAELRETMAS